jgi:hypothetical protein
MRSEIHSSMTVSGQTGFFGDKKVGGGNKGGSASHIRRNCERPNLTPFSVAICSRVRRRVGFIFLGIIAPLPFEFVRENGYK